jgi:nucleotide-binding universal stress UspA family protein
MASPSRILCPVDLSDLSRHAFAHARVLARWYDVPLTVLHVYGPQGVPPIATEMPGTLSVPPPLDPADVIERVREFCAGGRPGDPPLDVVVEEGIASKVIVARAREVGEGLLVMATHGRSGFDRLVLGSVTEKVLRSVQVPVLTVPPPVEGAGEPLYRRIVCALDFSDASRRALEYALLLAREADARLVLLHVVEEVQVPVSPPEAVQVSLPDLQRHLEREATGRLQAALPEEARSWCSPEVQVAVGKPYREIVRVATDTGADLIVMGVHGRGAIDRWLFGSTANHVIRQARCPVLTLRG